MERALRGDGGLTTERPATSVDVARVAGLSQATVSRALNGGVVSEATRHRVLEISQRLGYRPNAVARGLVMNRTRVVGVVISANYKIKYYILNSKKII